MVWSSIQFMTILGILITGFNLNEVKSADVSSLTAPVTETLRNVQSYVLTEVARARAESLLPFSVPRMSRALNEDAAATSNYAPAFNPESIQSNGQQHVDIPTTATTEEKGDQQQENLEQRSEIKKSNAHPLGFVIMQRYHSEQPKPIRVQQPFLSLLDLLSPRSDEPSSIKGTIRFEVSRSNDPGNSNDSSEEDRFHEFVEGQGESMAHKNHLTNRNALKLLSFMEDNDSSEESSNLTLPQSAKESESQEESEARGDILNESRETRVAKAVAAQIMDQLLEKIKQKVEIETQIEAPPTSEDLPVEVTQEGPSEVKVGHDEKPQTGTEVESKKEA